jgi:UDP-N-acetylglucosamine acyltransferase
MIDPRAIVDSKARLGKDVSVGAFSIIGPDVEVGDGTWIGPHVVINGPTTIGKNNKIYQFCSLGDAPQHLQYKNEPTRLEIGDRNTIREYCSFNRGTTGATGGRGLTSIGSDNFIMAYVHVAHDCAVGDKTIFANCASLAGHVDVGDYAILGGFTVAHQFCRIGAHCITALGTITFKDIPPYVVAAGNTAKPYGINLKGLQRRDFSKETIAALRRAYKTLYKSGYKLDAALKRIQSAHAGDKDVDALVEFVRGSERGIIR